MDLPERVRRILERFHTPPLSLETWDVKTGPGSCQLLRRMSFREPVKEVVKDRLGLADDKEIDEILKGGWVGRYGWSAGDHYGALPS